MNKIVRQHDDANYVKEQNNIEKYLMKVIQRYFLVEQQYTEGQKEAIIVESIRRIKIYLAEHVTGVFAINRKTGLIHLDITDVDGEPEFEKKSSFNKDFGTSSGTICEGNDERLSNNREPSYHTHYADDVQGLAEMLADLYSINIFSHIHDNKEVIDKITYTGDEPEIDLALFEQFIDMVSAFIIQIENLVIGAEEVYSNFTDILNIYENKMEDIRTMYEEFKKEQQWVGDAKTYTDEKATRLNEKYRQILKAYVTDQQMHNMLDGLHFVDYTNGSFNINPVEEMKFLVTERNLVNEFDILAHVFSDRNGDPLQGVTVKLDNASTKTTDSTGMFKYDNVSRYEHVITFSKNLFYDTSMHIFLNSMRTEIFDVYMVPIKIRCNMTTHGYDYDEFTLSSNPNSIKYILKEVSVTVYEGTSSNIYSADITDDNGECYFDIYPTDIYSAKAECVPDYITEGPYIINNGTRVADFNYDWLLKRLSYIMTVYAVDIDDNEMISDSSIILKRNGSSKTKTMFGTNGVTYTVSKGRDYTVSASHELYELPDGHVIDNPVTVGSANFTKNIYLKRKTVILTIIIAGPSDEPILANSTVKVQEFNLTETTNSNGTCEFTVKVVRNYTIVASHTDYITKTEPVSVDKTNLTKTITLEPITHELTILLKDVDTNLPISGANVNIAIQGTTVGRNGTTNNSGQVSFQARQNRTYIVKPSHNYYETHEDVSVNVGTVDLSKTITLKRKTVTVTITLCGTGPGESVLANGTVVINGTSYTTDSNGKCTVTYRAYDSFNATGKYNGYSDDTVLITTSGSNGTATITLEPIIHILTVIAKDEDTDAVISGAVVKVNLKGSSAAITNNTNNDGKAEFSVRENRQHIIKISCDGYESHDDVTVNVGTANLTQVIKLKHTMVSFKIALKGQETIESKLAGGTLVINGTSYTTDSNGEYTYTGRVGETVSVTGKYNNYNDNTVQIAIQGIMSTQNITLTPITRSLTVNVKDGLDGTVISGATVTLSGNYNSGSGTTDANGNVTLTVRQNRSCTLNVSKAHYDTYNPTTFNIYTTNLNKTVTLMPLTASLKITISDQSGSNMSGVSLVLDNTTNANVSDVTGTTNSNGVYTFTVKAGDSYTVKASKSGYTDKSITVSVNDSDKNTSISKNIVLERANIVYGYVYNTRTNTGISGATVKTTVNSVEKTATTNSDGKYEFTNIPTGTYSFTVSKTDYETDTETLENVSIFAGVDKQNETVMLSPIMIADTIEFNVRWTSDVDVDTYVVGSINGSDVNVYFSRKTFSSGSGYVTLDVDDLGKWEGASEPCTHPRGTPHAENVTAKFALPNDYLTFKLLNRGASSVSVTYSIRTGHNTLGSRGTVSQTNTIWLSSQNETIIHTITPNNFV